METQVVIIGAGPAGLYAAARLGRQGVNVTVVERNTSILRHGSKALCIQSDVLDLLEKVDGKDYLLAHGCPWKRSTTYVGDVEVKEEVFEREASVPPFLNIAQWEVEEILLKRALESNHVKVLWEHEFKSLTQDEKSVSIILSHNNEQISINSQFVIAADGSKSAVRDFMKVPTLGQRHADRFLIVDMTADIDWPKERKFWFDAKSNPSRQIVMHPQPKNGWRVDWQLPTNSKQEEVEKFENVSQRVKDLIGPNTPFTLDWISSYRFNQNHLTQLRVGNVIFAGDSAHSFPPFGARGMNSGIQDAENASWKLAAILNWNISDSLLDTYHEERYLAAKENIDITRKTIRFMAPPTIVHRWYRNTLLKASAKLRSGKAVNSGKMSEPAKYYSLSTIHSDISIDSQINAGEIIREVSGLSSAVRERMASSFTFILSKSANASSIHEILARYNLANEAVFILDVSEITHLSDRIICQQILEAAQADIALVRPDGYLACACTENGPQEIIGNCLASHSIK